MKKIFLLAMVAILIAVFPATTYAKDFYLMGRWDLYGTDLQEDHIWKGYIVINRRGDVTNGKLISSRGDEYDLVGGHFEMHYLTRKVTGTFSDSDGQAMKVEATMVASLDQITGVYINTGFEEEGMFLLVKTPTRIRR